MVGFFHVSSIAKCCFFGWCTCFFFCLVELQILPSLYSGVIKLQAILAGFLSMQGYGPILRFFPLKRHGLVWYHITTPVFFVLFQKETRKKATRI